MDAEQLLHAHWSSQGTLSSLVPPEQVYTSVVPPETPTPFVRLDLQRRNVLVQTTHHVVYRIEVEWTVVANSLEQARQISRELRNAFHHQQLPPGEERVLWLRFSSQKTQGGGTALWEETVVFEGLLALPHSL